MTLRNRFLLIGLGILIFLIVTPILVLFARGFKLDLQTLQITKTGAIVIQTEPAKATVVLNGKVQSNLTPATVRFLLPGDYDIQIMKEDYQSWTKRLTVRSQLATWANAGRDFITLFFIQPQLLETYPIENLSKFQPESSAAAAAWSIVGLDLVRTNREVGSPEIAYANLPVHSESQIIIGDGQVFLLLDHTLYAFNDGLEEIYRNVKNAVWYQDSRQLLLTNDYEAFLYNPDNKQVNLIFRSTTPIRSAQLNLKTGYLFLEHDSRIKAIELDARDHRNIFTLVEAGEDFIVDDKGEKLYVMNETEIKEYQIR